ncbi:DUF1754-domain-containing protein [Microthyrium microscopicum]|uniref:DUF1754-domain-containing protein n=1 Tax=Microthyrium microscopicum TaxID=703497 RepID=A0A6A6UD02_9PEZI|nr:DUF1754-domain-containing protein [Microthyrium microscopicum]
MPSSDYTASSGALKIKGVGGVSKKKKKKAKPPTTETPAEPSTSFKDVAEQQDTPNDDTTENTVARTSALEDEERQLAAEFEKEKLSGGVKTESERRFEETRRKRLEERLRREGVKTHKERVEELNRYLSRLSEHHDMPRIGPG